MRTTHLSASAIVIDDFLSTDMFASTWAYIQSEDYTSVFSEVEAILSQDRSLAFRRGGAINRRNKVWRLSDGEPLRGKTVAFARDGRHQSELQPCDALSMFVDSLIGSAHLFQTCLESQVPDWTRLTATPLLYPAGTALSWHSDGRGRNGAFIFYAHPRWNVQWGGELLVADNPPYEITTAYEASGSNPWLDNNIENELLLKVGIGRYVQPTPNRLVIIGAGMHHCVSHVNAAAGNNVRCTISGFFGA